MRCMIDTNIILDVFLDQEPFCAASKEVLRLCEARKIVGLISASSVTDLFYIVRKRLQSTEKAYAAMEQVMNIVGILPVTPEDIQTAFLRHARDFEDCLIATCAVSNHCDAIVTRNQADFVSFGVPLLSPEEIAGSSSEWNIIH